MEPRSHAIKPLVLPWHIAFPPAAEDRYSIRYHLQRVRRLMQRFI
jgi:hypothetical protein